MRAISDRGSLERDRRKREKDRTCHFGSRVVRRVSFVRRVGGGKVGAFMGRWSYAWASSWAENKLYYS